MAGIIDSNRDLWQFLTGISLPVPLIAAELARNKNKLTSILQFYGKQNASSADSVRKDKSLSSMQQDFILKLASYLELDEIQCSDLYCAFLLRDYRGSKKDLQDALSSDRHRRALTQRVRSYYINDRLYLLRCLKHLLSLWEEEQHPYSTAFAEFVQQLYGNTDFIHKVMEQYIEISQQSAPAWTTAGNIATDRSGTDWLVCSLHEQCELLELMLLYYRSTEHKNADLLRLLEHFKKHGFGRSQINRHLVDTTCEPILQRIGFLQILLVVEALELEQLADVADGQTVEGVLDPAKFEPLNNCLLGLGDCPEHGPLLLMWSAVCQARAEVTDDSVSPILVRKLGQRALQLRVFEYLAAHLAMEPFSGKTVVASVSHSVVYGLLCLILDQFHEDTLGEDIQGLYKTTCCVLQRSFIASDFWARGLDEGVGTLLHSCIGDFPLTCVSSLNLLIALAKAGEDSSRQVINVLQNMTQFTERLDRSTNIKPAADNRSTWLLTADRIPYNDVDQLVIPRGSRAVLRDQPSSGTGDIVQWSVRFDGWDALLGEVHLLLNQVSYSAGAVQHDTVVRVSLICQLVAALLAADGQQTLTNVPQCQRIIDALYHIVHRFCVLSPAPLDLLASCLDVLRQVLPFQSQLVWQNFQQTGFLPFVTAKDVTNISAAQTVNSGTYGTLLVGQECITGRYPLTEALLQLISAVIEHTVELTELMPFLQFLSQQMFPVLHKWRYYDPRARDRIGQKCLNIFSKLLNSSVNTATGSSSSHRSTVRDSIVQYLLQTEASRTLFDLVRTGVDAIEAGLASQGSALEGAGIELIELVCGALAVLNRLLLLWPEGNPATSVTQSLSSVSGMTDHRLVATVAQYIYHRHSTQLPCLATTLLTTLAQLYPMSMLSCLGTEVEAIRNAYLARLQATTEDVELKVVILKWFATCVHTQPGVIEMFLNIQSFDFTGLKDSYGDRTSCLQTIVGLIATEKQGKYQCPAELLHSATIFIHALWKTRQLMAIHVLRQIPGFWHCLCHCLHVELPAEADGKSTELATTELKTRANVYRILALELYHLNGEKADDTLSQELKSLVDKKRFLYWSQFLAEQMSSSVMTAGRSIEDNVTLHLLLAWRDLLTVCATNKIDFVSFDSEMKLAFLTDFLTGIEAQFQSTNEVVVRQKLASHACSTYLLVLRHWSSDVVKCGEAYDMLSSLRDILRRTCIDTELQSQSMQISLLGACVLILQQLHTASATITAVELSKLTSLLPTICEVIQLASRRIDLSSSAAANKPNESKNTFNTALKLLSVAVSCLQELIVTLGDDAPVIWLPDIKQHSILLCLLSVVSLLLQNKSGIALIQSIFLFFLTMSRNRESAEALAMNGLNEQLCVPLAHLYTDIVKPQSQQGAKVIESRTSDSSMFIPIYRLYLTIISNMLQTLCNGFVADAITFVGVHQQRMHECLESTGQLLTDEVLQEAEETCQLLACLSMYQRDWRLHLPASLQLLMTDVCSVIQVCTGLLIRPSLLQYLLDRKSKVKSTTPCDPGLVPTVSVSRHLLQQSSVDDTDFCTPELLNLQHRLLNVTCQCLVCLRHFSPDLCDLLLSQNFDVTLYDAFVSIGFGAPPVERQQNIPTFGTFVSIVNLCLKLLQKFDGVRFQVSPQKPQTPISKPFVCDNNPIQRSLVMFVMENALMLTMSQVMRCLRDPVLSQRDKQLLKRELSAELNSFLMALQRYLRSTSTLTPVSPQFGRSSLGKSTQAASQFATDQSYFRMVDIFVKQVLR